MNHSSLSFLTIQQISARWNMDILDVHKLILTGRLAQSFLLSGLATITRIKPDLTKERHPLCWLNPASIRVLIRAIPGQLDRNAWAVADVEETYDCTSEGINRIQDFRNLCAEERTASSGWVLIFDPPSLQIAGEDSFQLALRAFQDTTLISAVAIADFEKRGSSSHGGHVSAAMPAAAHNDSRRQRCRVAAQIFWERNVRATVPDLYQSEYIQRIACEGRPPTEKTFREWVKDLNPNRSAGRRAVQDGPNDSLNTSPGSSDPDDS